MTTFVPLAADTDGTASAVAVGEWLLHLITLYDSEDTQKTKEYYRQFMCCFTRDEAAGETKISEPLQLLSLLLTRSSIAFKWLGDIKAQAEQSAAAAAAAAAANATATTAANATAANPTNAAATPSATTAANQPETRNELKKPMADALKEVEEFYLLLMSLVVLRVNDVETAGQLAGSFCSEFRSSTEFPEFRLRLLMGLYNVFPPTFPYRFPIFVAILEYALETNLFHVLLPYIKYINEWIKDWNLGPAANRQVYLMLSKGLKTLGKTEEAFDYLKRHLQFFQGESEAVLMQEETISAALELVIDSINTPEILYFDCLCQLDPIKILKKTKHHQIYFLLEIFSNQGPEQLQAIFEQYPDLATEYDLNYENCLKKLRLLSVASCMHKRKEITFKEIAEALKLTENEGEEIAVQAIGLGLVDAKVDQINRVIYIRTAIQREFGIPQWQEVLRQLEQWSSGVRTLRQTMETVKNTPEPAVPSPVSTFN